MSRREKGSDYRRRDEYVDVVCMGKVFSSWDLMEQGISLIFVVFLRSFRLR